MDIKILFLPALFWMLLSGAASADTFQVLYSCDLAGEPATLTANVEIIGNSGVTYAPNGDISGVIGTGDSTIYYQGQLQSQYATYVFTGENQFADFTDMTTYERFRVQFTTQQDGSMILTANPFGPMPTSYRCILQQAQ